MYTMYSRSRLLLIPVSIILIILTLTQWGCVRKRPTQEIKEIILPDDLTADTADFKVEGNISRPESVYLDVETITAFPEISFTAHDLWDNRDRKYTGASLIQLLDAVGMDESATAVEVFAENDYHVPIRISDLRTYEYILCYRIDDVLLDGATESLQNKGSLVIAINFHKHPDMDVDVYKNQLVWQVTRMIIQ